MPRYIDAELLDLWMRRNEWGTPDERWRPESEFGRIIDSIPTAVVEEVNHKEWEEVNGVFFCTRCGDASKSMTAYCCNCGAEKIQLKRVYASIADVLEVRHGYWYIKDVTEYEYYSCSACGESYHNGYESIDEAEYGLKTKDTYKYCPNCGAKMDGKESGE